MDYNSQMKNRDSYNIPVVIEQDQDGFFAFAPSLQGCYTQGDNYQMVVENIREAIRGHLLDRLSSQEELPFARGSLISLTNLEVAV